MKRNAGDTPPDHASDPRQSFRRVIIKTEVAADHVDSGCRRGSDSLRMSTLKCAKFVLDVADGARLVATTPEQAER
jgi:hypothetical protein